MDPARYPLLLPVDPIVSETTLALCQILDLSSKWPVLCAGNPLEQPIKKAFSHQSTRCGTPLPIAQPDDTGALTQGLSPCISTDRLTPPIPKIRVTDASPLRTLIDTARNPLAIWTLNHFTRSHVTKTKTSGKTTVTEIALARPDLIRHVLDNKAGRYGTFPGSLHCHDLNLSEGMGANQALAQSMAQFSLQALNGYFPAMETEASLLADKLLASHLDPDMPISPVMSDVVSRMIQTTLLAQVPDIESQMVMQTLEASLEATGARDALTYLDVPAWVQQLSARLNQGPRTKLRQTVLQLVSSRRNRREYGLPPKTPDLIGALINAFHAKPGLDDHDEQITSMVIAILSTCYATSHRTLVWALALLACAPDIQLQCAAEARALCADPSPMSSKIEAAQMVKAVISETLRLYPPVPVMRRTVLQDDFNHHLSIAKGSTVLISPWVLHRHHMLWYDPDSFIPERFSGEARHRIAPYTFLPFGGGEQTCIGFGYMMQATRLVLLALLNPLALQYPAGQTLPVPVQRVGLLPQSPISLIVRPRGP